MNEFEIRFGFHLGGKKYELSPAGFIEIGILQRAYGGISTHAGKKEGDISHIKKPACFSVKGLGKLRAKSGREGYSTENSQEKRNEILLQNSGFFSQ